MSAANTWRIYSQSKFIIAQNEKLLYLQPLQKSSFPLTGKAGPIAQLVRAPDS